MSTNHELKDYQIAAIELRAIIEGLGATIVCAPDNTPLKKDEWAVKANAARVICTISAPPLREPFTTPYAAGIGIWLPAVAKGKGETARLVRLQGKGDKWTKLHARQPLLERARAAWNPELFDVIASCLRDSDALDYDGDFEEWASNSGYEPDSRSAETTFCECERIGRAMKRLFGKDFDKARELAGQL